MSVVLETEQAQPKRRIRTYSDREKAETLALLDNLGSLAETSRVTGIPDATISAWNTKNRGINPDVSLMREGKSIDLASKLEVIAHKAADLLPGKLDKANARTLLGAIHITVPAVQLLRGLPTNISASVMSEDERRLKLAEVLERLEAKAIEGTITHSQTDESGVEPVESST